MGIYETPYEDFGRLTYEMSRACRLVIDTGVHQFGWTREQAMDYLQARAALSEHEITTEVERYIAWPGQALAYKLGELQIRRHVVRQRRSWAPSSTSGISTTPSSRWARFRWRSWNSA
jgi:uncharacterized protein (DUF885 family)